MDNQGLKMFARKNGSYGIRNHLVIISTVACANVVAEAISRRVPESIVCTHPYGCDQLGKDAELTFQILLSSGVHPNVGAALVVGLGCEEIDAEVLAERIQESKKPSNSVIIQKAGGTSKAIEQGVLYCQDLMKQMWKSVERVDVSIEKLVVGLECGGSDYSSGIGANPAVGVCSDLLVSLGARVIFGETTELLGAEHILAKKAASEQVKSFILNKVHEVEQSAKRMNVDIRGAQPSPGNIDGGLSSIEEKSLGGICKAGTSPIVGCVEFGLEPKCKGLSFMDTPGNDLPCTCGLVTGGAHIVLFTTGRGTPMGFAFAPVIKITANQITANRMAENTDIDISAILENKLSVTDAGKVILEHIIKVASGELVAAEKLGHCEFGFHRIGPTL